jgi:hypothetical protein
MFSVFDSSAINRGFEPRSSRTKDYKIDICCFSTKHASPRSKSTVWLGRNRASVSEWGDIFTRGLLVHLASSINIQLSVLV